MELIVMITYLPRLLICRGTQRDTSCIRMAFKTLRKQTGFKVQVVSIRVKAGEFGRGLVNELTR